MGERDEALPPDYAFADAIVSALIAAGAFGPAPRPTCDERGCMAIVYAGGKCSAHYRQARRRQRTMREEAA